MVKSKVCTKCYNEYPATLEYFYANKQRKAEFHSWCKKCCCKAVKKYQQIHRDACIQQKKKHYRANRKIHLQKIKEYQSTIKGHLLNIYTSIRQRCNNPTGRNMCYKGIRCLFTFDEFVDYVINDMKVDPRGLQIHRIDNNRHYEKGNIEFVTDAKHRKLHKAIRKKGG